MNSPHSPSEDDSVGKDTPAKPALRRISLRDLMGNAQEILIEHAGQDYRLRVTRQKKLILTK